MWRLVLLVFVIKYCHCQSDEYTPKMLQILHTQGESGLIKFFNHLETELKNRNITIPGLGPDNNKASDKKEEVFKYETGNPNYKREKEGVLKDNGDYTNDEKEEEDRKDYSEDAIVQNSEVTSEAIIVKSTNYEVASEATVTESSTPNKNKFLSILNPKYGSKINDVNITQHVSVSNDTPVTFVHVNIPNSIGNTTVVVQIPISVNVGDLPSEVLKNEEKHFKANKYTNSVNRDNVAKNPNAAVITNTDNDIIKYVLEYVKKNIGENIIINDDIIIVKPNSDDNGGFYSQSTIADDLKTLIKIELDKRYDQKIPKRYAHDTNYYLESVPKRKKDRKNKYVNIGNSASRLNDEIAKTFNHRTYNKADVDVQESDIDIAKAYRQKIRQSKYDDYTTKPGKLILHDALQSNYDSY